MLVIVNRMKNGKPTQKLLEAHVCDGCLSIRDGKKVDSYQIEELAPDHPDVLREFTLTKPSGDVYCVRLRPRHVTCTCVANEIYGTCKHSECVRELCDNGSVEGLRLVSLVA